MAGKQLQFGDFGILRVHTPIEVYQKKKPQQQAGQTLGGHINKKAYL